MKEFKLKVTEENLISTSLGVSDERMEELVVEFEKIQEGILKTGRDTVPTTELFLKISELDITPEEYTFLVFNIGAQANN